MNLTKFGLGTACLVALLAALTGGWVSTLNPEAAVPMVWVLLAIGLARVATAYGKRRQTVAQSIRSPVAGMANSRVA